MRDTALASLLGAGVVLLLAPFAMHSVDWLHDGVMLKAALDVHAGQVLFRDTVMFYGALSCYLQVLALWIYPSLLSLKLLTVAAYAVSVFFNYLAWRKFLPRSLTLLGCAFYILFIPTVEYGAFLSWSSVYAMMFQSIALYAIFQVIEDREAKRWGFVVGLAAACTFWCRQPVGILLVGALIAVWISLRVAGWKPPGCPAPAIASWMIGGFLAVNAIMLATIILPGALPAWWHQNFVWPASWASKGPGAGAWSDYAWPALRPTEAGWLLTLFAALILPRYYGKILPRTGVRVLYGYYVVLFGVLLWQHDRILTLLSLQTGGWMLAIPAVVLLHASYTAGVAFGGRQGSRPLEFYWVATLGVLSLASLPQYFPVSDPWHVCWALSPVFGFFVYALWRWTGWRASILTTVLAGCLVPSALHYAKQVHLSYTQPVIVLDKPSALQGVRVPAGQWRTIQAVSTAVDPVLARDPTIPSALFGGLPLVLAFTANRENPSPYCYDFGLIPEAENQKRYRYIHDVRPLLFLDQAARAAMKDYLPRIGYESRGYIAELDLEILAPREVLARD